MIINKISLFNYGPFKGKHELDLSVKVNKADSINIRKNIILIGGNNGSGKTTFLKGVQICLYGQVALGGKTSKAEYYRFLDKQIHQSKELVELTDAFIEVDFDLSISGSVDNYKVRRTWKRKVGEIDEDLEIYKNSSPLREFEKQNWQEFVYDLIPMGLLKLFFFDGERINSLVKDESSYELRDSIRVLLGLDVVNQLKSDLIHYQSRDLNLKNGKEYEQIIDKLEAEIVAIEHKKELVSDDLAHANNEIEKLRNNIERIEAQLRSKGGTLHTNRKGLLLNTDLLKQQVSANENRVRDLFASALPFYYASKYRTKALKRIKSEAEIRGWKVFTKEFRDVWKTNDDKIKKIIISNSGNKKIVNELYELIIALKKHDIGNIVHDDASDLIGAQLEQWYFKDAEQEHALATNLVKESEDLTRKITENLGILQHIPKNEDIASLISTLNNYYREVGELEEKRRIAEEAIDGCNKKIDKINKNLDKEKNKIEEAASHDRRLNILVKVNKVLDLYENQLIKSKIESLQSNVLGHFSSLLHKKDLLKLLRIDEQTFNVTLEDEHGREVDRSRLSEGEKQVYSVSMLAGVAKTSGRALPIFVDTPLSRLDSEHRANLVHKYFPTVSHQVIILSTDTEIDEKYFNALKPYVARSYLFDHNKAEKFSTIKKAYFWV